MRGVRTTFVAAAVIAVAFLAAVSPARGDAVSDAQDKVAKAKAAREAAVAKAAEAVTDAFDAANAAAAGAGDLAAVKQLAAEKQAFKATRAVPASPLMKDAAAKYRQETAPADAALAVAYDQAIAAATAAKKPDVAAALKADRDKLAAAAAPADPVLARLEQAKADHAKAVADAKAKLLSVVDQREKAAADAGDLKALKAVQEFRTAAAGDGPVAADAAPDAALKLAVAARDRAVQASVVRLAAAYDATVKDLTRARRVADAEQVVAEREATVGEAGPAAGGAANAIDNRPFDRLNNGRLPGYLVSPGDGISADKTGVILRPGKFLRTRDGNFLDADFTFDVVFTLDQRKQQIAYIGLGEGDRNGVFVRFHSPAWAEGQCHIAGNGDHPSFVKAANGGTHCVRVEKVGNAVTFSVDVDYDGKAFKADASETIPDVRAYQPNLKKGNTFLFFGNDGGVYSQVRFVSKPTPAAKPAR